MRRRMVVAKTQIDQQQQQRIVADETKPQAAVKGGESSHVDQTKYVQRPPVPWIVTKANPLWIGGGLQPPNAKKSRSPGERQPISSPNSQLAIAGG